MSSGLGTHIRFSGWLLVYLTALPCFSGCATLPQHLTAKPPTFPAVPATVFVTDGAGNFQMTSLAVRKVVETDGYPIDVITYEWSHGKNRIFRDQLDQAHARSEGIKLAARVQQYHADHPERPIYLLGHSAGATTLLTALEHLPPAVVERAILLAPSISSSYHLEPALHALKDELHVFYSQHDSYYLGIVTRILGTCDGTHAPTAGRVGFQRPASAAEPEWWHRLVQHPWQPSDSALGNQGGHFGSYQPDFLRVRVLPLFNPNPVVPAIPASSTMPASTVPL